MSDQILNSISKSFAVALASLNEGLANASKEISGLREKVASKQTQNGLLNTALIDAKSELVSAFCRNCILWVVKGR